MNYLGRSHSTTFFTRNTHIIGSKRADKQLLPKNLIFIYLFVWSSDCRWWGEEFWIWELRFISFSPCNDLLPFRRENIDFELLSNKIIWLDLFYCWRNVSTIRRQRIRSLKILLRLLKSYIMRNVRSRCNWSRCCWGGLEYLVIRLNLVNWIDQSSAWLFKRRNLRVC